MEKIASWIDRAIASPADPKSLEKIRREVKALTEEHLRVAICRFKDLRVPRKPPPGQQRGIEPCCRSPATVGGLSHRTYVRHEPPCPRRCKAERVL